MKADELDTVEDGRDPFVLIDDNFWDVADSELDENL